MFVFSDVSAPYSETIFRIVEERSNVPEDGFRVGAETSYKHFWILKFNKFGQTNQNVRFTRIQTIQWITPSLFLDGNSPFDE